MVRNAICAVTVCLGLGIGFLLLPAPDSSGTPPERSPSKRMADTPEAAGAADSEEAAPRGEDARLALALLALPRPDLGSPTGVITGKVTLEDGTPLAGVDIDVWIASTPKSASASTDDDFDTYVRKTVKAYHYSRGLAREAISGEDGAFMVDGIGSRKYGLRGKLPGYRIRIMGRQNQFSSGDEIQLEATPVASVVATLVMPDGSTPEKATIEFRDGRRSRSRNWSSESQTVYQDLGQYQVRATVGEDLVSPEISLTLEEQAEFPITLELESRIGIRGQVVFPEGENPVQPRLQWLALTGDGEVDPEKLAEQGTRAWARNEQRYKILDIAPGRYAIGVSRGSKRFDVIETVTVGQEIVELDVVLPPVDRSSIIVAWCYGPDGKLLRNISFDYDYQVKNRGRSGGATFSRQSDGSYWIAVGDEHEDFLVTESATCAITAKSPDFGSRRLELSHEPGASLTFEFSLPARLQVTVNGLLDSGLSDQIQVALRRTGEGGDTQGGRKSFAPERRIVGPVEPGEYELALRIKDNQGWSTWDIQTVPVSLQAGEQDAEIDVPRLHQLTVRFPEEMKLQGWVTLSRELDSNVNIGRQVKSQSEMVYDHIPAGSYRIEAGGGGGRQLMKFQVSGDTVIDFVPMKINAMEVTIDNTEGFLYQAGFRHGDLIVGVEGNKFENQRQMEMLMITIMTKNKITMNVQRGSRTVDVTLEREAVLKAGPDNMGGNVEPATR